MTSLGVELHGVSVGELLDEGGRVTFRSSPSYWGMPDRPVLGQWFEDSGPDDVHVGPGPLPAFFANLEPEGALAQWLVRKNGLGSGPLELLAVAGEDLPGALRLVGGPVPVAGPRGVVYRAPLPSPSFSLAGVQLKLPMSLDRDDRLVLPLDGEHGAYLVKLPSASRYHGIVENEAATMSWARHAGFDVAECTIRDDLVDVLDGDLAAHVGRPDPSGLLVRRFDRTPTGPIHQEDFAQVAWLDPDQKYPRAPGERALRDEASETRRRFLTTAEGLAQVVARLLGPAGLEEYLRRFVFVVASGNGDAHLKNWSVQYRDRRKPEWTPLYDQVSTVAWGDATLACPLYGTRNFPAIGREQVVRMAVEAGCAAGRAAEIVDATITSLRGAFGPATAAAPFPEEHRRRVVRHWERVRLLKGFGSLRT